MSTRLLIVEDNPDNTKLIEWMLEDAGYQYECVETGEDALAVIERRTFELVLMDISLPGIDGMETTRRMRRNEKTAHIPIIAVTAHAVKGEMETILSSGVSRLIIKPIDESLLLSTIKNLLSGVFPHEHCPGR